MLSNEYLCLCDAIGINSASRTQQGDTNITLFIVP